MESSNQVFLNVYFILFVVLLLRIEPRVFAPSHQPFLICFLNFAMGSKLINCPVSSCESKCLLKVSCVWKVIGPWMHCTHWWIYTLMYSVVLILLESRSCIDKWEHLDTTYRGVLLSLTMYVSLSPSYFPFLFPSFYFPSSGSSPSPSFLPGCSGMCSYPPPSPPTMMFLSWNHNPVLNPLEPES